MSKTSTARKGRDSAARSSTDCRTPLSFSSKLEASRPGRGCPPRLTKTSTYTDSTAERNTGGAWAEARDDDTAVAIAIAPSSPGRSVTGKSATWTAASTR